MPNVFVKFILTRALKFCIVIILLVTSFLTPSHAAPDQNSTVIPLFQKKNALSQSLDSLDLLKQNKKREGRPLSEIELKQQQLIDSLQLIRKIIQADIAATSKPSNNKHGFPLFRFLNLSDLTIIIVAITILFTGILLLLGTIKNAFFRAPEKISSNKSENLGNLSLNPSKSLLSGESLDFFDTTKSQETIKDQTHFECNENNTDHPDNKNDDELETKIIKAASEGMSIQEMSRLFHLSSDHITLILKLAESGKK
jgi:hypothetical protein